MDEPSDQLRRHYDSQSLSPEATERILHAANAIRKKRRRIRVALLAAAAAVVLGVSVYSYRGYAKRTEVAQVERNVQAFFSQASFALDNVSDDHALLLRWLIEHGAPANVEIPRNLAPFPSVGCKTIAVGDERAYIICFQVTIEDAAAAPRLAAAAKPAAKKEPTLVHLVVIKSSALRHSPGNSAFRTEARDGWSFATAAREGVTYVVATTLTSEQLATLLAQS